MTLVFIKFKTKIIQREVIYFVARQHTIIIHPTMNDDMDAKKSLSKKMKWHEIFKLYTKLGK